ncbi:hypothetical protein D9758_002622 [Tetrapyrgos nigripes]|uniref:Small ribosomal subunit protein uS10m n=1 Tax=Tetrapyrgos nigripes TaxID=182062 RepID=A0A8H5GQL5_9AGAR|nr:hypothetical protein D9758_002622 [Tetrapyrgos nigripes]
MRLLQTLAMEGEKKPSLAANTVSQDETEDFIDLDPDLEAEFLAQAKQLEEDAAALGLEDHNSITDEELKELGELALSGAQMPSLQEPEKLAENEEQLFERPSSQPLWPTSPPSNALPTPPKLDPRTLPRDIPLERLGPNPSEEDFASTLVHGRSIHLPFFHPKTHGYPAAVIQFRSYHPRLLDLFSHFATHAASSLGIPCSRVAYLPTQRTLWTVPRSPFIYKKSQENFERKVHKRMIKAWDADEEVVERWFKYLRKHELGGVGMRMVKWERMELGVGRKRLAHLKGVALGAADAQSVLHAEQIRDLGAQIVKEEMTGVTNDGVARPVAGKEVVVQAKKST